MNDQFQSLDQVKASAIDRVIKFGPKRVVALVILSAGYMEQEVRMLGSAA